MSSLFLGIATFMVAVAIMFLIGPLLANGIQARAFALFFAVLIPMLGFALYISLGTPAAAVAGDRRLAAKTDRPPMETVARSTSKLDSVAKLVDGLAKRLESEPDDASGWLLLARSYEHLGRVGEAAEAYGRAKSLGKSDDKLEALTSGTVQETTVRAEIRGRVSLAPSTSSIVRESDSVFVFAKALNGSPMPLAVIKKPAADLPFDFDLSDDNSMVKGLSLSDFKQVEITARISRSGNVMEAESGLEARSEPVPVAGGNSIVLTFTTPASTDES